MTPESSALFVLVRKVNPDKVLEELKDFKGKVIKTSLAADKEESLRKILEDYPVYFTSGGSGAAGLLNLSV